MKKIIILAIALLSTGIVLSSSLKKNEVPVKPAVSLDAQKNTAATQAKNANLPSYDAVSSAD
jgi:hypothetical protein